MFIYFLSTISLLCYCFTVLYFLGISGSSGVIYILGGFQQYGSEWILSTDMFGISITTDQCWIILPPMKHGVCWPLIQHFDDCMYVIGGYNSSYNSTKHLQIFNKTTQEWTVASPVPVACDTLNANCIIRNNKLTIFTAKEYISYNSKKNKWRSPRLYSTPLGDGYVTVLKHRNNIIACSEAEGVKTLWRFESALPEKWVKEELDLTDLRGSYNFYEITL